MPKKKKVKSIKKQVDQKVSNAVKLENDFLYKAIRIEFIDKFTLCDLSCKVVIEQYRKVKKQEGEEIKNVLDMRTIPHAMKMFGYEIDRNILNGIFGGSKSFRKQGTKSAKKLRDGIVHGMCEGDLKELIERKETLFSLMDTYLAMLSFDTHSITDEKIVTRKKDIQKSA